MELAFVLVLGNQWMFDHVVEPWSISTAAYGVAAQSIGWFSWLLAPQHGLTWVWLGGLLHAVVWLLADLLAGAAIRADSGSSRAVLIGHRFGADRGDHGAARYPAGELPRRVAAVRVGLGRGEPHRTRLPRVGVPGSVGGGAIVAVAVVGVLSASALAPFVLPADDSRRGRRRLKFALSGRWAGISGQTPRRCPSATGRKSVTLAD